MSTEPLFEVRELQKWYPVREGGLLNFFDDQRYLRAVDGVSFDIERGEIIGVAGQSGCGKSTLGELLLRLQPATGGEIRFEGSDVLEFDSKRMKEFRRKCQIIFQDPYESLNPRFTVGQTVEEPLKIHNLISDPEERTDEVLRAIRDAGLKPPEKYLDNLPSELSGGERQRVSIARALVLDPDFLVADEPVSMLDVSVRTDILHLFEELQKKRDLTMLYISHDLSTINYLADRALIMYLGNVVELGTVDSVIHDPAHPYTEALLHHVPNADPDTRIDRTKAGSKLDSEIPDPIDLPEGCRFHPRCQYSDDKCREKEPLLERKDDERKAACYYPVSSGSEQSKPTN